MLVLHGQPGGVDQAQIMARFLPAERFRAICVSRPGYLGTELGERRTTDEQAELFLALLEHLGVDRAAVLGYSGGGPAAYRLAVLHPDRISAVIAVAAVSEKIGTTPVAIGERLLLGTRLGARILRVMARRTPKALVYAALKSSGSLRKSQLKAQAAAVSSDPDQRRFLLDMPQTVTQLDEREPGARNDDEQYEPIDSLQLDRIACPCLVVVGTADTELPPEHSAFAAATIPAAELIVLELGTHLAFWAHPDAPAAQAQAVHLLLDDE